MPTGMENPLLLMGGDFEFSSGDEISGYFSHRGKIYRRFFQWGGVPTGSETQGG